MNEGMKRKDKKQLSKKDAAFCLFRNHIRYKMIEFCYIPVKGDEYGIEDATLALKSYEEQLAMGNHFVSVQYL